MGKKTIFLFVSIFLNRVFKIIVWVFLVLVVFSSAPITVAFQTSPKYKDVWTKCCIIYMVFGGWGGIGSLEHLRYLRKAGQKKTETRGDENKKKQTSEQRKHNYTNLKSHCIQVWLSLGALIISTFCQARLSEENNSKICWCHCQNLSCQSSWKVFG